MAELDELRARLVALERRVRRLTAAVALLAVGLVLAYAWNVAPRPELSATRFMLRDSTGAWRGALAIREDGSPTVRLNDPRGRARLYGVVTPDTIPMLRLMDATGANRLVLELGRRGEPRVRMTDATGRARAIVRVEASGRGVAELGWGANRRTVTLDDSLPPDAKGPRGSGPRGP